MIADDKTDKSGWIKYNFGRPTTYRGDFRLTYWQNFHYLIEYHFQFPIGVNGAYERTRDHLFNHFYNGGGGFQYCFWFRTQEELDEFLEEEDRIYKEAAESHIVCVNRWILNNVDFRDNQEYIMIRRQSDNRWVWVEYPSLKPAPGWENF